MKACHKIFKVYFILFKDYVCILAKQTKIFMKV